MSERKAYYFVERRRLDTIYPTRPLVNRTVQITQPTTRLFSRYVSEDLIIPPSSTRFKRLRILFICHEGDRSQCNTRAT
jgi:hypothetical protein